ncbi:MAG: hypothetical protein SGILL_003395, partial [Bacillariaceae sp.]
PTIHDSDEDDDRSTEAAVKKLETKFIDSEAVESDKQESEDECEDNRDTGLESTHSSDDEAGKDKVTHDKFLVAVTRTEEKEEHMPHSARNGDAARPVQAAGKQNVQNNPYSVPCDKSPPKQAKQDSHASPVSTNKHDIEVSALFGSSLRSPKRGNKKSRMDCERLPGKHGEKAVIPRYHKDLEVCFFMLTTGTKAAPIYLTPTMYNFNQGAPFSFAVQECADTFVWEHRNEEPRFSGIKKQHRSFMAVYVMTSEDVHRCTNNDEPKKTLDKLLFEKATLLAAALTKDVKDAMKPNKYTNVDEPAYIYGRDEPFVAYEPIQIMETHYGNEKFHLRWWMSLQDALRVLLISCDEINNYQTIMDNEQRSARLIFGKDSFDEQDRELIQAILAKVGNDMHDVDIS